MLTEKHGVRVRILPSLCEPDDWHAGKTFVGNIQDAEAYVWNKVDGLIEHFTGSHRRLNNGPTEAAR